MPLTETVPTSLLTRANLHNFSVEEKKRREEAMKNKDFFYARQEEYVDRVNNDVDPITINLTNVIVKKKLSLLYSRGLVREFDGPSPSVSFLEELYHNLQIDRFLRKVDLAAELSGTGMIYIGFNEAGEVELRLFDASEFSVVGSEDQPDIPEAISLVSLVTKIEGSDKNPNVRQAVKTQVWTDNYITTYMDGVRDVSETNELEYLPFTFFKGEEVYGQILGHAPAYQVRLMNTYLNQQMTNLGYMIKMQSATPAVVTGFQQGEGITIHPGRAISLPAGATADVLELNPKIEETLKEIQYLEEKVYETACIPKVSVVGDQKASSGKELLIKWYPLIQIFKEKTLRYQQYELDLANMILKVNGLEPLDDILVKYPEEALMPLSPESEELRERIRLGISTPIDAVLQNDPTMDEAEAEALVRSNMDFNKSILPNPGGLDNERRTREDPEPKPE